MYNYGIVRWCGADAAFDTNYKCTNGINGGYHGYQFHGREGDPPTHVWYESKEVRNYALEELVVKYPGVMYCPVEVTTGFVCKPGDKQQVSIDEKGVLPK